MLHGLLEVGAEGHNALLVALARHLEFACLAVHIGQGEPRELAQADARGVEGEEDGAVALALVGVGEGGVVEEAVHLCLPDEGG